MATATTDRLMTIDQMRRMVDVNATGWEWEDENRRRGFITTKEGRWSWDDTAAAYALQANESPTPSRT